MANLHVTYDDLRQASGTLVTGRSDIDARLLELRAFVDALVAEGYVTTASSGAFQETYAQFTSGAQQTVSALSGLSEFLRAAADALQQTDEQLAASIRAV